MEKEAHAFLELASYFPIITYLLGTLVLSLFE